MNVSLTQKEKEMSSLRKRMNKKFKCCINVALFTIYLRRFNEKMRLHRRIYFDSFMKNQLTSKLVEIKRKVIED